MTHELMQHQVDFYLHTNLSQRDWVMGKKNKSRCLKEEKGSLCQDRNS